MFNLFKNNKYISCDWIEYGMACMDDGLNNCCVFPNPTKYYAHLSSVKNGKYDFKEFFKIKNRIRLEQRQGKINERCIGCPNLRLNSWDTSQKIRFLVISSYTKCNSDCIYCYTHRNKFFYNTKPYIPIKQFIKDAVSKKIIDNNTHVNIGGGEPTINEEFEDILNILITVPNIKIKIYSSGIKYSLAIENCLKKDAVELVVSPDCGNKYLYKQIKGVDKFDEVWTNLTKYAASQNLIKTNVIAKYIILNKINDTKEIIQEFFDMVVKANIKTVKFEVDYNYCTELSNNIEKLKKIFQTLKFMENYADKLQIKHIIAGNLFCLLEKNKDVYENLPIN